jgi:hypothetical protein
MIAGVDPMVAPIDVGSSFDIEKRSTQRLTVWKRVDQALHLFAQHRYELTRRSALFYVVNGLRLQ